MIGQTIRHYRIVSELRSEGTGVVYKAEDIRLGRMVAIKFLSPELAQDENARKRLAREAEAISRLQHNNICAIREVDRSDDGRLFICRDYYEGETLTERLARGPIGVEEALRLIVQIGDGLEQAHRAGIVHRDIKPANIVVTDDGIAKLLDFGLARFIGPPKVIRDGSASQVVAYMSPEQLRGEELDARSDIFSMGIVFYETLTGINPFRVNTDSATIDRIIHHDPPTLAGADPAIARLEPVIMKMLAKKASDRYRAMANTLEHMAKLRAGERVGHTVTRNRRTAILFTAAIVSAAVAMWWLSFRHGGR